MKTSRNLTVTLALGILFVLQTSASAEEPYEQIKNIVYAESHGIGLVMDIFKPNGNHNGLGIVDVASGAWHSDRGKIRDRNNDA